VNQMPWFERKFDFSFPVEQLPNLCARLCSTPFRLETMFRGRPLQTLVRRTDGKWSTQENAGHLLDLEPLWIVRIADYVSGNAQLTEADLTNRQTDEANHNATPTYDIESASCSNETPERAHLSALTILRLLADLIRPALSASRPRGAFPEVPRSSCDRTTDRGLFQSPAMELRGSLGNALPLGYYIECSVHLF